MTLFWYLPLNLFLVCLLFPWHTQFLLVTFLDFLFDSFFHLRGDIFNEYSWHFINFILVIMYMYLHWSMFLLSRSWIFSVNSDMALEIRNTIVFQLPNRKHKFIDTFILKPGTGNYGIQNIWILSLAVIFHFVKF